jgi:uncharacterized protein YndB with AHSA1/START domain
MTSGEIRKTLTIDAPPQVVFSALTDEKEFVQWWPYEAKIDPRVGGRFEFKLRGAAKGFDVVFVGRVTELVPGKKLAYAWESPHNTGSRHVRPVRMSNPARSPGRWRSSPKARPG